MKNDGDGRLATVLALAHAGAMSAVLLLFIWPGLSADTLRVPVGIVAPSEYSETMAGHESDAFTFTPYQSRDEAIAAVDSRVISGALVLGSPIEVIVGSGGNAAIAEQIRALGDRVVISVALTRGGNCP